MKTERLFFYSTKADFLSIISAVDNELEVEYYLSGHHKSESINSIQSLSQIASLGQVENGSYVANPTYLALPKGSKMFPRRIDQNNGNTVYAVDMLYNPDSLFIIPSGINIHASNLMIVGNIAISTGDKKCRNIFNTYRKIIKKHFTKTGSVYVGQESMDLLKQGWRLTQIATSPIEYDLRLPG